MKPDRPSPLTEVQAAGLIVIFASVIGLLLRVAFPLLASFPLNDGGLFYTMIRDLQANHYILPSFTSYNHAGIPYAYPPLAFYLSGWCSDLTGIDLLTILRLLPPVLSAVAIPVFYLLAKEFLPTRIYAAAAALLLAVAPRVFAWQIMGGGITRSLGFCFALLTILSAADLFSTRTARSLLWTSGWGALTVLTHPEAIPQTTLAVLIIYLFRARSRRALWLLLAAAGLIMLCTSPWWLAVLRAHGPAPYLAIWSAANSNSNSILARPVALLQFLMTEEPLLPLLAFLGLIGAFRNLAQRKYFLPAWLVLPYLLDPRSGPLYMMIPLLFLAVEGLFEVILPGLGVSRHESREFSTLSAGGSRKSFLIFLLLYLLIAAYFSAAQIFARGSLNESQVEALRWIREHTAPDAAFLAITGGQPLLDPASDWFPALTERSSPATVFGTEWIEGDQFGQRIARFQLLQQCAGQTADCITLWSTEHDIPFTHVYLQTAAAFSPLAANLATAPHYNLIYQADRIWIFERVGP